MSEKIPIDNETRQVRAVSWATALGVATVLVAFLFFVSSCTEHQQTHPTAERCLPGTIYVQVSDGWACAPQVPNE